MEKLENFPQLKAQLPPAGRVPDGRGVSRARVLVGSRHALALTCRRRRGDVIRLRQADGWGGASPGRSSHSRGSWLLFLRQCCSSRCFQMASGASGTPPSCPLVSEATFLPSRRIPDVGLGACRSSKGSLSTFGTLYFSVRLTDRVVVTCVTKAARQTFGVGAAGLCVLVPGRRAPARSCALGAQFPDPRRPPPRLGLRAGGQEVGERVAGWNSALRGVRGASAFRVFCFVRRKSHSPPRSPDRSLGGGRRWGGQVPQGAGPSQTASPGRRPASPGRWAEWPRPGRPWFGQCSARARLESGGGASPRPPPPARLSLRK